MKKIADILHDVPSAIAALAAVIIFTLFESLLKRVFLNYFSIDIYLFIRMVSALLFLMFLLNRFDRRFAPFILDTNLPHQISWVFWLRGIAWLFSIIGLAAALIFSPLQAFAYAAFFLHPGWTALLGRIFSSGDLDDDEEPANWLAAEGQRHNRQLVERTAATTKSLIWPVGLTIVGAILFAALPPLLPPILNIEPLPQPSKTDTHCAVFSDVPSASQHVDPHPLTSQIIPQTAKGESRYPGTESYYALFSAFFAGIFFAASNVLSSTAKGVLPKHIRRDHFIVSSTITLYSTYTAMLVMIALVLALLFLNSSTWIHPSLRLNLLCISLEQSTIIAVAGLIAASVVVTFASVLFAKAFVEPSDQVMSATIDLGIMPFSFIIGVVSQEIPVDQLVHPIRVAQYVALAFVLSGAIWTNRRAP
jgi:hypothetical protein